MLCILLDGIRKKRKKKKKEMQPGAFFPGPEAGHVLLASQVEFLWLLGATND
jgi:hypothetical protein